MSFIENIINSFNDDKAEDSFTKEDIQKYSFVMMLCYLIPILFFVPIIINGKSKFCCFHANQQLALLVIEIVIGIIMLILGLIPVIGAILDSLLSLALLCVAVFMMYAAYKGKAVRIPFVGNLINIF
ncbi:MAG: hypothetical protein LUG91_04520 [Ruminococcus sp.]|nr:hypothetical protein [Ruminococcus sp.]